MQKDYKTIEYKTPESFRAWLATNHADVDGVWVELYKKASGIPSITYAEAFDSTLCYG